MPVSAGMGGAGFPSAVKLNPGRQRPIDTLIVNATECEPYITADDSAIRERAAEIVDGHKNPQRHSRQPGQYYDWYRRQQAGSH